MQISEMLKVLKELHDFTSHEKSNLTSMIDFLKQYGISNTYITTAILKSGIVKSKGRQQPYFWSTDVKPNIHMANRILKDAELLHANRNSRTTEQTIPDNLIQVKAVDTTKTEINIPETAKVIANEFYKIHKRVPTRIEQEELFQNIKNNLAMSFYEIMQNESEKQK